MRHIIILFSLVCGFPVQAQHDFGKSAYKVKKPLTHIYAEKDGDSLYADIYSPDNTARDRPVFVFMHGGGFSKYSPRQEEVVKLSEMAASYGYVAIPVSYRLTRKGKSFGCDCEATEKMNTFKMAVEDLFDALRYIVDHKEELGIDPGRIILGGSSAGAEAVLSAAYNRDLLLDNASAYDDIRFSGVLSLAGALPDVRYITAENAIPAVFFHGMDDDLVPYATASHHYCGSKEPGYLILDGPESIVKRLKNLNVSYMLNSYEQSRHELAGVRFGSMDMVFDYFNNVFLGGKQVQIERVFPKNRKKP